MPGPTVKSTRSNRKNEATTAGYTRKDILLIRDVFEANPQDGNGNISIKDFVAGLSSKGIGPVSLKAIDQDGSGTISFDEYLKVYYPDASKSELEAMKEWAYPVDKSKKDDNCDNCDETQFLSEEQEQELRAIFKLYDSDSNGVIDRKELATALDNCGYDHSEIEDLFNSTDVDSSDEISVEEFVQLMKPSYI